MTAASIHAGLAHTARVHGYREGIVVAGTGNATVHHALEAALRRAAASGVVVRRASRGLAGRVVGAGEWPDAGALGPFKTRVELLLELLAR